MNGGGATLRQGDGLARPFGQFENAHPRVGVARADGGGTVRGAVGNHDHFAVQGGRV